MLKSVPKEKTSYKDDTNRGSVRYCYKKNITKLTP
jgi:hypothetical protein